MLLTTPPVIAVHRVPVRKLTMQRRIIIRNWPSVLGASQLSEASSIGLVKHSCYCS